MYKKLISNDMQGLFSVLFWSIFHSCCRQKNYFVSLVDISVRKKYALICVNFQLF